MAAPESAVTCPNCGVPLSVDPGGNPMLKVAASVGNALGKGYRVEELVGRGGYALVFRVHDERLDRKLACKTLIPQLIPNDEIAERFRREARTAARLSHPNIVPIYFVGTDDGAPCYVMPLVEGETLAARIRREGQLPLPVALGVVRDVSAALDFAHQAGIVHRDVKPENIIMELASGRSLLMDFGIAKALQHSTAITLSGVVLGTPHYLSPEQAAAEKEVDGRTDVYSLGVVLFEMLAGQPPYDAKNAQALVMQHVSAPIPSLAARRSEVNAAFDAVVARALAKEPHDRFTTAGEFMTALEGAHGGGSLRRSNATVLTQQGVDDPTLFRTLEVAAVAQPVAALAAASDIATIAEAAHAAEALALAAARQRDGVQVAQLIRALRRRVEDPQRALRSAPQDALRHLAADPAVTDALAASWLAGDQHRQGLIEETLIQLLPDAADYLVQLARREKKAEIFLLADRVGALDDARVEAIAKDTSPAVVQAFAKALKESSRPASSVERWCSLVLRHPRPEVRTAVLESVAARGGALAERIGRVALRDKDGPVRISALRALGRSQRRESVPDLARVLEQGDAAEQLAAAIALGTVGLPEVVAPLARVFDRKKMLRLERGPLQAAAAQALAQIASDDSLKVLAPLANDRDALVAQTAAQALAARLRGGRAG
jgi:HEAT repeat protein/tRNA A-37 threonylcarbamoyl transferase component Bud32